MRTESLAMSTVKLGASQVNNSKRAFLCFFVSICQSYSGKVLMMSKSSQPKQFEELSARDKDLTMFTITKLSLNEEGNLVFMALKLKRKVATELLTTYLPTVLLLLITYTTVFFDKDLFGDAIAVNLTIMLVMTTIFTSKIEELPPTSDMKMIDLWLIFCLVVPFTEVILRTMIESLTCVCCSDEETEKKSKTFADHARAANKGKRESSEEEAATAWVGTATKVAPKQVAENSIILLFSEAFYKISKCD